jgi:hypothetical protein
MKTLFLALGLLALGTVAKADGIPGGQPQVLARATYDCPPGPGYMNFAVIDASQYRTVHQLWLGSREICQSQAERLYQTRSTFTGLTLIGICTGQDDVWYLKRWSVDVFGRHAYQGQTYYGPLADCLAVADQTNAQP